MLNKFQESTPHAMAQEMGNRLRQVRLNKNLTQAEIAERAGLDRRRVIKAENGNASLEDFFAILDVLEKTDQLVNFLPEQRISPVQLLKLRGKLRQRASSNNAKSSNSYSDEVLEW